MAEADPGPSKSPAATTSWADQVAEDEVEAQRSAQSPSPTFSRTDKRRPEDKRTLVVNTDPKNGFIQHIRRVGRERDGAEEQASRERRQKAEQEALARDSERQKAVSPPPPEKPKGPSIEDTRWGHDGFEQLQKTKAEAKARPKPHPATPSRAGAAGKAPERVAAPWPPPKAAEKPTASTTPPKPKKPDQAIYRPPRKLHTHPDDEAPPSPPSSPSSASEPADAAVSSSSPASRKLVIKPKSSSPLADDSSATRASAATP